MIENRISCYLYNELLSESNEQKCMACSLIVSMDCFLIVHKKYH